MVQIAMKIAMNKLKVISYYALALIDRNVIEQ